MTDSASPDLEAAQQRTYNAEARANDLEIRMLRTEIAATKSVPPELLTGTTQDEIETAAQLLLDFAKTGRPPVGIHLPNQDRAPTQQRSPIGETARRIFTGQN